MKKFFNLFNKNFQFNSTKHSSLKPGVLVKLIYLAFDLLAILGISFLLYAPICLSPIEDDPYYPILPKNAFESLNSDNLGLVSFSLIQIGILALIFVATVIVLACIIKSIISFKFEKKVEKSSTVSVATAAFLVLAYTFFCAVFSPINQILGGCSYSKISIFPVIYIAALTIGYTIYAGIVSSKRKAKEDLDNPFKKEFDVERKVHKRSLFLKQAELLGFSIVVTVISALSLLSDIITATFDVPLVTIPDFTVSGMALLKGDIALETVGERTLSFLVFVLFFLTLVVSFISIIAFSFRSSLFNRICLGSILTSGFSCLLVGLFGQYYKIVQTLNTDIVFTMLEKYSIPAEEHLKYTISSTSMMYCYIVLGVLCILFVRKPFSKAAEIEKKLFELNTTILAPASDIRISEDVSDAKKEIAQPSVADTAEEENTEIIDLEADVEEIDPATLESSDPCPAFTELDKKQDIYSETLEAKRSALFENPSLPSLVNFIVQYARDSRLHLFYTPETVAAFLAGLGSTKLTILQGMSGTGKTSLPKIVSEALCSVCDIVEIESSWRDKNELLGYYNEFSKIYTPKKFTQALYKAALNPEVITFIVLDEMNLSRIEYYFSDFLSLMENEEGHREIKLLNTPISRTVLGEEIEYKALVDKHTIKIPSNIWFIGTANRDESTYDISDKVYDRAHTMNFDKRAKKPTYFGEPISPRYLPAATFISLFEEAKASVSFDLDKYSVVAKAEKLLEPYNISFGNRVAIQMESFVRIYASCFTASEQIILDALDTILLSKVVKKLELKSVEDKETLADEFRQLELQKCSDFIMGLKED